MDISRLIAMANRIGEFFDVLPNAREGMQGVASHIGENWDARMRLQLGAHLDASAQTVLNPFVERALRTFPDRWRVAQATNEVSPRP